MPRPATEYLPVEPDTVTVLGDVVTKRSAAWRYLHFDEAVVRDVNLAAAVAWGDTATQDHHLDVPDHAPGEERGCSSRIRPRMRPGQMWKGRVVKCARFVRGEDGWRLEVQYEGRKGGPSNG